MRCVLYKVQTECWHIIYISVILHKVRLSERTLLCDSGPLRTTRGGHGDTAAGLSQPPVSSALKIRAHVRLNSATISRVCGRKLERPKPKNPLSGELRVLEVLKCLYSLQDRCTFNTTVHNTKYSGRNTLLYHATVSWGVDVHIQGIAEITPTFWRAIKIKRNKVHKKFLYL